MDKFVVVGDLHGRYEIVEQVLNADEYKVLFIGDYLDSFTRSITEQLHTINLVLGAIRKEPERVFGLKGNHELSYVDPRMRCSGYSYELQNKINYTVDMEPLLDYMWVGDYLVSHAGISQRLLDAENLTLEQYLEAGDYNQIGRARGGRDAIGGLYWCDWWQEFEPIEDVPQVVGHSNYRPVHANLGVTFKGKSCNIDCLERGENEVLVITKDGAEPCPLEDL